MEDKDIIISIQNGRTEEFSVLVERYHRQLLSFIYKIVKDPSVVEDIGQDVFLKIFSSLNRFDPEAGTPFSAWLFIIARNQAISHLRNGKKWRFTNVDDIAPVASNHPEPLEILLGDEEKEAMQACLQQLEEPYRSTLISSLEGKPIAEIANIHNSLPGTIKSRLHRAKKQLQALVRKHIWSLT